jgi:predicted permease
MFFTEWLRRLWYLLNRSRIERELQQEMDAHREMMGEPVRFGNSLRLREESRDVWGWNWLDAICRDVRHGLRGLRREPTFAAAAILTLGLGIATTTTVFSVVDSELWRPLPFPQPEQLVAVYSRAPGERGMIDVISASDLIEWRAAPAFSSVAAVGRTTRQTLQLRTAVSVSVTEVTGGYFKTIQRKPIAGVIPLATDATGGRSAVLTDRAWKRVFASDTSIIGRTVALGDENVQITAIIPADDSLGPDPDIFLTIDDRSTSLQDVNKAPLFGAIGRLQPGVAADIARSQLQAIETRLAQTAGAPDWPRTGHSMHVEDLGQYFSSGHWRPLYFFLGAALVVLLLSITNVATLLLARAFRRTREFAVRGALGGSAKTFARYLIVEAGLVALSAAGLALILTAWAVGFFATQLPSDFIQRGSEIPIDFRVYGLVLSVSVLITTMLGITPLLFLRHFGLSHSLGSGVRTTGSRVEGRTRTTLLVTQIALTVVLLSGAGLFLKSFLALTRVPLGFDPTSTLTERTFLTGSKYADDTAVRSYARAMLDNAGSIPGVRSAAVASSSPLGSGPLMLFTAGETSARTEEQRRAIIRAISPDYFRSLGIPVVKGREFAAGDSEGAPRVAVVNETLARQAFPSIDPIGRTIRLLPARAPWTNKPGPLVIVGVVPNVKEVGINEVDISDIYVPFDQMPAPAVEVIVRSDAPLATVSKTLKDSIARIDPSMPVGDPIRFEQRASNALQGDRFNLLLISGFAFAAVLLAAVGIYGNVAYNTQARAREFGIRLALGARPERLVVGALMQAARFVLAGGIAGVIGALVIAVVIGDALYLVPGSHNGLLYGVTTTDPTMLGSALLLILVVAGIAAVLPARKVADVDPVSALRND